MLQELPRGGSTLAWCGNYVFKRDPDTKIINIQDIYTPKDKLCKIYVKNSYTSWKWSQAIRFNGTTIEQTTTHTVTRVTDKSLNKKIFTFNSNKTKTHLLSGFWVKDFILINYDDWTTAFNCIFLPSSGFLPVGFLPSSAATYRDKRKCSMELNTII